MSQFYASITGSKGEATRQGSAKSGITGHIRGWEVGISVHGRVNAAGKDEFSVVLTTGSAGNGATKYLGTYTVDDLEGDNGQ